VPVAAVAAVSAAAAAAVPELCSDTCYKVSVGCSRAWIGLEPHARVPDQDCLCKTCCEVVEQL
jgi:hypothetical protein